MYREVVILTLLVAVTFAFRTSGLHDSFRYRIPASRCIEMFGFRLRCPSSITMIAITNNIIVTQTNNTTNNHWHDRLGSGRKRREAQLKMRKRSTAYIDPTLIMKVGFSDADLCRSAGNRCQFLKITI